MIISLILFVLISLLIFHGSFNLVDRYLKKHFPSFLDKLIAAYLFSLSFIILTLTILGVCKLLYPFIFITITVAYWFFCQVINKHNLISLPNFPKLPLYLKIILVLFLLTQIYTLFFIYNFPPFANDVLGYHLPPVVKWYHDHRLHPINSPSYAANSFPMNQELIALYTVLLIRADYLIEFGHYFFIPLLLLVTYQLARYLKVNQTNSILLTLIASIIPAIFLQSVSNHGDLPVCVLFLTALYFFLHWQKDTNNLYKLAVFCIPQGIVLGTKSQGLYIVFILLLASILILIKKQIRYILLYLLVLLILGSFWYLKNFYLFKNPIFPMELPPIFNNPPGIVKLPGYGFSINNLITNTQSLILRLTHLFPNYHPDLPHMNGWGFWFIPLGIPALIYAFIKSKQIRFYLLLITSYVLILYSSINPDPWNSRFFMIIPLLGLIALGFTLNKFKLNPYLLSLIFLIQLTITLINGFAFGHPRKSELFSQLSQPLSKRYSSYAIATWDKNLDFIHKLPLSKSVAYFGEQNELGYMLYDPTLVRQVNYIQPQNLEYLKTQLKIYNTNFLVVEPTPIYASIIAQINSDEDFYRVNESENIYYYSP